MTSPIAAKLVREEIQTLQRQVDSARNSAGTLRNLILYHYPQLVPEASLVFETATLLEHAFQNFRPEAEVVLSRPDRPAKSLPR